MAVQLEYKISGIDAKADGSELIFQVVPAGPSGIDGSGNRFAQDLPKAVPVRIQSGLVEMDWSGVAEIPVKVRAEIEAEIRERMKERSDWMNRVNGLVEQVEQWAKKLEWSTRRLERKLEDDRIGTHRVPALLMQEDTIKILLEPLGRSSLGTEGVADLYLLPGYDDIASLYYHDGRWNVNYMFVELSAGPKPPEARSRPLTEGVLGEVLSEMKQHVC